MQERLKLSKQVDRINSLVISLDPQEEERYIEIMNNVKERIKKLNDYIQYN